MLIGILTVVNKKKVKNFNNFDFHERLETASKTSYVMSLSDFKDPNLCVTHNIHKDSAHRSEVKEDCC